MNRMTIDQMELLRSRFTIGAEITVDEFTFKGWEGEWQVLKDGKHIDVFTFCKMGQIEFNNTLNDIFYNTEKVTFQ